MNLEYLPVFSFLSVAAIAVFTMVSIVVWTQNRRREREAFYRSEMLKKLLEQQGATVVMDVMRAEERASARKIREGVKIGGLVASGAGMGLLAMFWDLHRARPVGFVPLFVGLALLAYAFVFAPRD
jgi:Domain of unknown function (DUF6249)